MEVDTKNTKSVEGKVKEVIDTYETIQVSKPTDPVEESVK